MKTPIGCHRVFNMKTDDALSYEQSVSHPYPTTLHCRADGSGYYAGTAANAGTANACASAFFARAKMFLAGMPMTGGFMRSQSPSRTHVDNELPIDACHPR